MIPRLLRAADRVAMLGLWNESAPLDPLDAALLEEKIWADPGFDPRLAFGVEADGRLIGFTVGVVRQRAEGPLGYVKLIAVAEAWRRRGVGGRLLEAVEAGVQAEGVRAVRLGEAAPNYLTPGLDVRYTKALLFFEKHGYVRFGETYNLSVDLTAQAWDTASEEHALALRGFVIRRARRADWEDVTDFLLQHWPSWQGEVERSLVGDPTGLHLALKQGAVVGFAAYDGNNVGLGWFGPMGTAPACRGLGVGSVLLRRCLRDLAAQGKHAAVIPWVGPVSFYAHHAGADVARVFYRYEKNLT